MNKLIAFFCSPSGLSKREVPTPDPLAERGPENPHHEGDPRLTPVDFTIDLEQYIPITPQPRVRFANRQVQPGDFVWETNKNEMIKPRKMATPHLFYTLRMLFNHSIPPLARVGEFKRREHVDEWPIDYCCQATSAMHTELAKRKDVEDWMCGEMKDMEANAAFLDFVFNGAQNVKLPNILSHKQLNMLTSYTRHNNEHHNKIKALFKDAPPYDVAELERAGRDMQRRVYKAIRRKPAKKKSVKKSKVSGYFQTRNGQQVWINAYKR